MSLEINSAYQQQRPMVIYNIPLAVFEGMCAQAREDTGVRGVLNGDGQVGGHFNPVGMREQPGEKFPVLQGVYSLRELGREGDGLMGHVETYNTACGVEPVELVARRRGLVAKAIAKLRGKPEEVCVRLFSVSKPRPLPDPDPYSY